MDHHVKKILLILLVTLVGQQAIAREFSYTYEGQKLTYTVFDENAKTVTTKGGPDYNSPGNNISGELIIPSVVKDNKTEYTVIEIGQNGFASCKNLVSVSIPATVTSIGNGAFSNCSSLTEVTIPNSVVSIRSGAFRNCSSLTEVTIPNSVILIDSFAFSGCSSLTEVFIPNSVTSIEYGAFDSCSSLTEVTIPNSVTAINGSTFSYCSNLTEVTIPNSVISIGYGAFLGCSSLTEVTIPNSVTSIDSYAFYNCSSLTKLVVRDNPKPLNIEKNAFNTPLTSLYWGRPLDNFTLPVAGLETLEIGNTVPTIPLATFRNIGSLKTVTLGSGLTAIGNYAFAGCPLLTEIVIPVNVETIGTGAFNGCKLSNIVMGSKVTSIDQQAFEGSPASTVCITAPQPPTAYNNTFSDYSGKLYLQDEDAINAYSDALECWNHFDSYAMITPSSMTVSMDEVTGKPGDTVQLTATLEPDNVTLPQIYWHSTNPEVATVDNNGLVTFRGGTDNPAQSRATAQCKIIAESLYANGPIAEIDLMNETGGVTVVTANPTSSAEFNYNAPYDVYTISGLKVSQSVDDLNPGIYILRQGSLAKKVAVR